MSRFQPKHDTYVFVSHLSTNYQKQNFIPILLQLFLFPFYFLLYSSEIVDKLANSSMNLTMMEKSSFIPFAMAAVYTLNQKISISI